MNKDNLIKNLYNKVTFIIEIIIALVLGIAIYKISYKIQELGYTSKPNMIIAVVSGILLILLIIRNTIKYKKNIAKLFVTYIIPIGILFIILLPINWVPDEEGHMFKTYDISKGNLITPLGEKNEGDIYVPREMLDLFTERDNMTYSIIHQHLQKEANYDDVVPAQTIAKTYSPINYMSGSIVFAICRLLNVNILLACYIARLVNFLLAVTIIYFCIKIIPFGKLLLAIYMLLPMSIQQLASLSADVFINSISLLFIVYNLRLLYQEKDLEIKQKVLYYILALSIALCKYVYFPLVFMSILLIKNKNISKRNRNELIIVSTIASILVAAVWFLFSQKYVDVREIIIRNNVQPIEQIKYILKNPIEYIKILAVTFEQVGAFYVNTFIGSSLGLLNIKVPEIFVIIYLSALVVLPFVERCEKSFNKHQKWIIIGIALILILLIITGLYITWSPLKAPVVSGVQGRYFVPGFILILLAFMNKENKVEIKNLEMKYFGMYFLLNIIALFKVYTVFMK